MLGRDVVDPQAATETARGDGAEGDFHGLSVFEDALPEPCILVDADYSILSEHP